MGDLERATDAGAAALRDIANGAAVLDNDVVIDTAELLAAAVLQAALDAGDICLVSHDSTTSMTHLSKHWQARAEAAEKDRDAAREDAERLAGLVRNAQPTIPEWCGARYDALAAHAAAVGLSESPQ